MDVPRGCRVVYLGVFARSEWFVIVIECSRNIKWIWDGSAAKSGVWRRGEGRLWERAVLGNDRNLMDFN